MHWIKTGRPYLTAKWAMTLDGKIATHTGSSRWISGPAARTLVGTWRAAADAVIVGSGTVLQDDPSLTARDADDQLLARQPLRVVLDSRGRLPSTARLASGELPGRTLVATTPAGAERLMALPWDAVELWIGQPGVDGRVQPAQLLAELGRRKCIAALVESGGTLLATLQEQRLIDEVVAFIAPKLVGGANAPTPIAGQGAAEMSAAVELLDVTFERVGRDILVRGRPRVCSPGIVEEIGQVLSWRHDTTATLRIAARVGLDGTRLGDSIAVEGACLTVTALGPDWFEVGLAPETLRRTNLAERQPGDGVNLERATAARRTYGWALRSGPR